MASILQNAFPKANVAVEKGRRNAFEVDLFLNGKEISIWSGDQ